MKLDLLKPFEHLPYFTIEGFKQSLDIDEDNNQRVREMLSRWFKCGHIQRLKRGVYMTRRFYELHQGEVEFRPAISAVITPLSYISLEYILQNAEILTEITYPVTAVTRKNTSVIENPIGTFSYRHIQDVYYCGFSQHEYHGIIYGLASVAKALFDYFYLRPLPRELRSHQINYAEDLRLNIDEFSPEDQKEFTKYVFMSESAKLEFILENLRRHVWRP